MNRDSTMPLLSLPAEIILLIIKKLDISSIHNLYNTCLHLRKIICMQGIIKNCSFSLNIMATSHSLRTKFFKDICVNLKELNLSGVPDLYKTSLLPLMKRMKVLKTLDISYTNITMSDCLEILQTCPSIKDIAVNFIFGHPGLNGLSKDHILSYQHVFEHLENVHFIGASTTLLYSQIALLILQNAVLHSLTYSISQKDVFIVDESFGMPDKMVKFSCFSFYLLDFDKFYGDINTLPIFFKIKKDISKYEFITMHMYEFSFEVGATPLLRQFICENFQCKVNCLTDLKENINWNHVIMIWDKEYTKFDNVFYSKLLKKLKKFFVHQIDPPSAKIIPTAYDMFFAQPNISHDQPQNIYEKELLNKRKRVAPASYVLDYDSVFKDKQKIQLSISFGIAVSNSVTLSPNSDYLRKLTFLCLNGNALYSIEFFNILFRCCNNLITLNVVRSSTSSGSAMSSLLRSIPLSKTLKNIRLVDRRIDFSNLFTSFSQSKLLENIHIEDTSTSAIELPDPSLVIRNCENLYNIYIRGIMSNVSKINAMYKKAKSLFNKRSLNIQLHYPDSTQQDYMYSPYLSVFNIYHLQPHHPPLYL